MTQNPMEEFEQALKDPTLQLSMDYQNVFSGESGKRVLDNLSRECYENMVTLVKNDSHGSAFNEGKRFIILHIRRMMTYADRKGK